MCSSVFPNKQGDNFPWWKALSIALQSHAVILIVDVRKTDYIILDAIGLMRSLSRAVATFTVLVVM